MQEDFIETELSGSKWMILKALTKEPLSPKQVAQKLGTTIANSSQQLKLLEAYGYVKKVKVDRGKGARQKKDVRILYSLNKNKSWLTSLSPLRVIRKDIKQNSETLLLQNLLLLELKETYHLLKFVVEFDNFFDKVENLFFLRKEDSGKVVEIHLLVISEEVGLFREHKSSEDVLLNGQLVKLRFWSHTSKEFLEGLNRKEKYFLDLASSATLIYEKTLNSADKIMGGYS